jgi:hypothetical protein
MQYSLTAFTLLTAWAIILAQAVSAAKNYINTFLMS